MSAYSKGKRNERKIKDILIAKGWYVFVPIWNRFGDKDIFSLFDGVAVRDKELLLFQVKSNRCFKETITEITKFYREVLPVEVLARIFIVIDRSGIEEVVCDDFKKLRVLRD